MTTDEGEERDVKHITTAPPEACLFMDVLVFFFMFLFGSLFLAMCFASVMRYCRGHKSRRARWRHPRAEATITPPLYIDVLENGSCSIEEGRSGDDDDDDDDDDDRYSTLPIMAIAKPLQIPTSKESADHIA